MVGREARQEAGAGSRSPAREAQLAALLRGGLSEELILDAERRLSPSCPDLIERLWRDQRVSEEQLCAALSSATSLPRAERLIPPAQALALLPVARWRAHRALPISWEGEHLQLALLNPFDQELIALLRSRGVVKISLAVALPSVLMAGFEALAVDVEEQEHHAAQREGVKDFQAFLAWLPRPGRGER